MKNQTLHREFQAVRTQFEYVMTYSFSFDSQVRTPDQLNAALKDSFFDKIYVHRREINFVRDVLEKPSMIALLTGFVGTGKSTILRKVADDIEKDSQILQRPLVQINIPNIFAHYRGKDQPNNIIFLEENILSSLVESAKNLGLLDISRIKRIFRRIDHICSREYTNQLLEADSNFSEENVFNYSIAKENLNNDEIKFREIIDDNYRKADSATRLQALLISLSELQRPAILIIDNCDQLSINQQKILIDKVSSWKTDTENTTSVIVAIRDENIRKIRREVHMDALPIIVDTGATANSRKPSLDWKKQEIQKFLRNRIEFFSYLISSGQLDLFAEKSNLDSEKFREDLKSFLDDIFSQGRAIDFISEFSNYSLRIIAQNFCDLTLRWSEEVNIKQRLIKNQYNHRSPERNDKVIFNSDIYYADFQDLVIEYLCDISGAKKNVPFNIFFDDSGRQNVTFLRLKILQYMHFFRDRVIIGDDIINDFQKIGFNKEDIVLAIKDLDNPKLKDGNGYILVESHYENPENLYDNNKIENTICESIISILPSGKFLLSELSKKAIYIFRVSQDKRFFGSENLNSNYSNVLNFVERKMLSQITEEYNNYMKLVKIQKNNRMTRMSHDSSKIIDDQLNVFLKYFSNIDPTENYFFGLCEEIERFAKYRSKFRQLDSHFHSKANKIKNTYYNEIQKHSQYIQDNSRNLGVDWRIKN